MSDLNVVIIDDEKNSRELLETLLEKYCTGVNVKGMADTVSSGVTLINNASLDLIFLDIEMPGGDGFTLLENLKDGDFSTCFVTGYKDYALKAIKYGCLDYLLKPVEIKELKDVIEKAKKLKASEPENQKASFVINEGQKVSVVQLDDIISITADGNYSVFHISGKKILSTDTLSNVIESLDQRFYRTHKSHIINLNYVSGMENGRIMTIKMVNGEDIPVAARRKKEFLETFNKLDKS